MQCILTFHIHRPHLQTAHQPHAGTDMNPTCYLDRDGAFSRITVPQQPSKTEPTVVNTEEGNIRQKVGHTLLWATCKVQVGWPLLVTL